MGKLLCENNLRDVWCRNESVRAEIGPILHTHTHTRVSFSSIDNYAHTHIPRHHSIFSVWFSIGKRGGESRVPEERDKHEGRRSVVNILHCG